MGTFLHRVAFPLEFLVNAPLIVLYLLHSTGQIPAGWDSELVRELPEKSVGFIPILVLLTMVGNFLKNKNIGEYLRLHIFSLFTFIPMLIVWGDAELIFLLAGAHLIVGFLSHHKLGDISLVAVSLMRSFRLGPAHFVLISFSAVILLGTLLLMLPIATVTGDSLGVVDAFFMATSATCVTGLATKSLGGDLSFFGQLVVLFLIQVGGLSIMTLYSSMTIILGRSMGMKDRVIMQDLLEVSSLEDLVAMITRIIKYTLFIEMWGAVILTIAFTMEGLEFGRAIYYGFFHSISAFCNAGFSLFDSSLEAYATNPLIHGTIAVLVTLGGLGFIVLSELREVVIGRKSLVRLGLHSKIVLITSILLTASGAFFIFFGEFLNSLDGYSLWEKMQISLFQSVTLRTAGFNTIPLTGLHNFTLYMMTLLMFIGGSPGSTAGGVKTTTLAILIQSIIATMRGQGKVSILDRTVSSPIVVRATALTFISILMTSSFIFILMRLEPAQNFLAIFFEVISASGTVGLTLGITPYLSVMGKIAVAILMLAGRIGPLTLILAIGQRRSLPGKFDYPAGQIMIG